MIIGRDLLQELKMDFSFSEGTMTWDNAVVVMKDIDCFSEENIDQLECDHVYA